MPFSVQSSGWGQLSNMGLRRDRLTLALFAVLAVGIIALNIGARSYSAAHPDQFTQFAFVLSAVFVLSFVEVRLDRGRLTLAAVALGAASVLLNPLDATIVALAITPAVMRRGALPIVGNAVSITAASCLSATVGALLHVDGMLPLWGRLFTLICFNASSGALIAVVLSARTGESVRSIVRHNSTSSLYLAFGYFVLASLLITYLIDGSAVGYVLTAVVCALALTLTDTIAGRRVRRVLESELSDADRHLFHSRAVEGVVHNLRNHIATAVGYLKEIDLHRLDPVDRDAVETATAAANDAVTVLRSLAQGATPRVSYAAEPVDLNELATRALGMARPRARTKAVEMGLRETPDDVKVKADPLLLREVITNLVNNAIDAAPASGHVELTTGRRSNGWPYFSVADNGPGVAEENRHHLFEPHFTTKEGGTGLGLFMSYGIIREHQGHLIYEGNRRGAIFTVALPPFGA
jgi:signal transduction histidine kinase